MALLLVGLPPDLGDAVARRLLAQGDQVRAVVEHPDVAERWRSLGVHVARGDASDADLIERAATNVRTIVVGDDTIAAFPAVLAAVVEVSAGAAKRIVHCPTELDSDTLTALRRSGVEFVVLRTRRGSLRIRRRRSVAAPAVALAVDAADDLAGQPRLDLDLTRDEGWAALGLEPP